MKKVFGVLALFLAVCSLAMAQVAAKENCIIEYDNVKKVIRLINNNNDPFTIQYAIDGRGKSVVVDKKSVWEFNNRQIVPLKLELIKVQKGGRAGAVDSEWKAVPQAAQAGSAPTKK